MSARYRVYCDGELFSDTYLPDPAWHAQEPKLKLGDNSAGSFEFALTPDNIAYSSITRMASTLVIFEDSDLIWAGRVISQTEDFFKRRKYTCEGALAFLNDTHVDIKKTEDVNLADLVVNVITEHNAKLLTQKDTNDNPGSHPSAFRQITCAKSYISIQTLLAENDLSSVEYEFNNETTLDWLSDNVASLGCHLYIRYNQTLSGYLDTNDPNASLYITEDYNDTSEQEINFGVNLLEFTKNWELSNLVTVIIPRGQQLSASVDEEIDVNNPGPATDEVPDDGLTHYLSVKHAITQKTQNGVAPNGKPKYNYTYYNSIYVYNDSAYNTYGRIERTVDFPDITDPTYLLKLARIYVRSLQFNGMQIEISAVDLHHIDNTITSFNILDRVHCISRPHGMDTFFPLIEMELDLENPANNTYTLGESNVTSLTGVSRSTNKKLAARFKGYPSPSAMLDVARYEASLALNNYRVRGYVNIVQESDTSQALVISDTTDWTKANHLWKWDMNGLGYSPKTVSEAGYSQYELDGQARWYKTAITANGQIVADFVSTGILSDGAGTNGNNWWDLSNGVFHLHGPAVNVEDSDGTVLTVSNIIKKANDAGATAEGAAVAVSSLDIGGANLLDGTKEFVNWRTGPAKKWSRGGDIIACVAPTAANWKTYLWSPKHLAKTTKTKEYKPITYNSIKNKRHTFSFEVASKTAWGTKSVTNKIVVRFCLEDSAGKAVFISRDFVYTATTKWTKKVIKFNTTYGKSDSLNFTAVKNYSGNLTPKNSQGQYTGSKNPLYFTVRIFNVSTKRIQFKHFKLEQGEKATAWCESSYDMQKPAVDYAYELYTKVDEKYKAAINSARAKFSPAQEAILKGYTKREAILRKLTGRGNSERNGIYVKNGELYMNATFIQTGYLKAGLIKTGILTNFKKPGSKGSFYFNLATGEIKANNMVLTNMHAKGTIENGTAAITTIKNGSLNFYYNNKMHARMASITGIYGAAWPGGIDAKHGRDRTSGVSHGSGANPSVRTNQLYNGMFLSSTGGIFLRGALYTADNPGLDTNANYKKGASGEFSFTYVSNVIQYGDGGCEVHYGQLSMDIENGIITSVVQDDN